MTKIEEFVEQSPYKENASYKSLFSEHDGADFLLPDGTEISIVSHFGSYGGNKGLYEIYDWHNEPDGYLTLEEANNVMDRHYKRTKKES